MNDNDDASESLKSKSKSKSSFKFGIRSRGRGRPKKINIREIDDMVGRGIPPPNDDDLKDYHHDGTIDGILFANIRRWQPENYQLYKDMPPRRREMLGKKYFTCQIQRRLKLRFRKEILPEYMEVMNEKYKWLLDSVAKSTLCSEGTNPARWHSQGERLIKPRPLKQVPNDSVGKNSTSNQNSASASTSLRKMLLSTEDSGLGNSSGNVSRIDELLTISSGGSDDSSGSKHHYGPQSSELTSALKRALADVEPDIPNKRTNRSASPKSPPNRDDSQEEESSEDESEESEDARETVPRRKSRKRSTNSSRSSLPISTTRIAFHDLFSTTQNDPLFFKKEPKFQQIAGRKLNRRLPREFTYIALDDSAKPPQIYIVFGDMEVYAEFDDLTHPLKNYFMDSMKQLLPKRGNDSKFMEVWKAVMEKEKKPQQRRERSSASSAVSSRAQTRKSSPAVISALKNRQEDVPLSNNNFSKPFPPGLRPSESTDFSQILEKGNVSSSFDGRPSRRRNSDTNAATIPNISITEYSASSLRASPSASSIASSSSDDDSTLADVIPNDDSRYLDVLFNNHRSTLNRFTGVMDLQVEEFKTMYKKFAIENFRLRKENKELKEQNLALLAGGGRDNESNGDNENLIRKIQELQGEVDNLRKSVDEKDRSLTEVKKALGL
ncbi:hypothetical protein BKA69DRAFT_797453 [Paraphysoderma sedebokerense]|nr:hypothetical protein BKA69DRAFT_797453 [Paraphysoderma sedebokerense]